MTDKPKLKRCPFCGNESRQFEFITKNGYYSAIECGTCLFYVKKLKDEEDILTNMWNTRAPTDFEVKSRELLVELSLSDFSESQLFDMRYSKEQFALNRADIAIMIRKFLEENGE